MGTEVTVTAWTADEAAVVAAFTAVFAEFDRLDALMSVWKPGSDVLRLNAAAGDHPVRVSPDTIEALRIAHEVSDWTSGTFDVTFGALSDVWKFDQDQDGSIPTPDAIRKRLPLIGYRASLGGALERLRKGLRRPFRPFRRYGACWMRTMLPDGSRNALSRTPYG